MDPARILLDRFNELYPGMDHHAAYIQTIEEFPAESDLVLQRSAFIGHVPPIEVGEIFRVRNEVMLAGLHDDHVRGICTGPHPVIPDHGFHVLHPRVATCVILRYPRHNFMVEGNLVVGGEGGGIAAANRMGFRVLRHQGWTPGNIAMRNSLVAVTPVRLVMWRREGNGRRYVYHGLYEVDDEEEVFTPQGFLVHQFYVHPVHPAPAPPNN